LIKTPFSCCKAEAFARPSQSGSFTTVTLDDLSVHHLNEMTRRIGTPRRISPIRANRNQRERGFFLESHHVSGSATRNARINNATYPER
jgi:hypothetical protein